MDKVIREESSVPVQGRISLVDLAKMDRYWIVREGVSIKSMSQLLSWTFTAMCDIIEANGKMPEGIKSVSDAHKYLELRGLYQQSMKIKGKSRITAALGFENLRSQGSDPALHSQTAYNTVHSKHSNEVFDGEVNIGIGVDNTGMPSKESIDEMIKNAKEDVRDKESFRQRELEEAKNSDLVVSKNVND